MMADVTISNLGDDIPDASDDDEVDNASIASDESGKKNGGMDHETFGFGLICTEVFLFCHGKVLNTYNEKTVMIKLLYTFLFNFFVTYCTVYDII